MNSHSCCPLVYICGVPIHRSAKEMDQLCVAVCQALDDGCEDDNGYLGKLVHSVGFPK